MYASFLLLPLLIVPPVTPLTGVSADWQVLVPRMHDGYGPGRIAVRLRTTPVPADGDLPMIDSLSLRTGVAATRAHGVRLEIVLPGDVDFTSLHARVADGLVLRPDDRSFVATVGHALLSVFRLLLFGKLVAAADDLSLPGTAWAMALGAPAGEDEMVRLTTTEELAVERGDRAFSDHGAFVVCRGVLALTPWTELVQVRIRGRDTVSGRDVEFLIPRIVVDVDARVPRPEPVPTTTAWVRLEDLAGSGP